MKEDGNRENESTLFMKQDGNGKKQMILFVKQDGNRENESLFTACSVKDGRKI